MATKPLPDISRLHYDPTLKSGLRWENGRVAGTCRKDRGWQVKLPEGIYYAHRIVWALHHGDPGDLVVDHINGNRSDQQD